MPFEKGREKTGGKPKGHKSNKVVIRDIIEDFFGRTLIEEALELAQDMPKKDRLDAYKWIAPYGYPRLNNVELSGLLKTKDVTEEQVEQAKEDLKKIINEPSGAV